MKETLKLLDRSPANILIFNAMAAMIPDDSDMLKVPDLRVCKHLMASGLPTIS